MIINSISRNPSLISYHLGNLVKLFAILGVQTNLSASFIVVVDSQISYLCHERLTDYIPLFVTEIVKKKLIIENCPDFLHWRNCQ